MSSVGYFASEDKIAIKQTRVAIPSENGLSYGSGQKIDITIPPDVQFFQPKESYLSMDVKIELPAGRAPTRLSLDEYIGGQVLLRDVRVYTMGGTLLEEIQNYNTLVSVIYDYDTNQNIKNKRALTEGTMTGTPFYRGTKGATESDNTNHITSPYYDAYDNDPVTEAFDSTDYNNAKLLLPLHTGIFQNDKIFPNTAGLRLEIVLEDKTNVFRQLDSVNKRNRPRLNPHFHSIDGEGTQFENGSSTALLYFTRDNTNLNVENFPFVVGEHIKLVNPVSGSEALSSTANYVIEEINVSNTADDGHGLIEVTITNASNNGSLTSEAFVAYSDVTRNIETDITYEPSFTVSNVEMILQKLEMPDDYKNEMNRQMRSGGEMAYDFLTYQNFKQSILSSDTVANIVLPLNFSRAKSILTVPTDATVRDTADVLSCNGAYVYNLDPENVEMRNTRGSIPGIWDNLQTYQFNYNNRLQPSRKVKTDKTSSKEAISQQAIVELEKALVQSGIDPRSFTAFQRNAVIGRALALQDGVYDCRGKSFQLQLEYTGTAPEFNKLIHNYVFHLRRLRIGAAGITVDV